MTEARATTITPRLRRPLEAISRFIEEHHHAPTAKELAALLDISAAGATEQIRALIVQQYIRRASSAWRHIEITPKGRKAIKD